MPKTYYVWGGVGAIQDLDGDDLPAATNRGEAWQVFKARFSRDDRDFTLWERDGDKATLLGIVTDAHSLGNRCFQLIDPDKSSKPLIERK